MLLTRFGNYFGGLVYIKIEGLVPEKFINLCIDHEIELWAITKEGDAIYAYLRLGDFFTIRPLVKRSHTHVSVSGYQGFPFFLKKVKRRKMFVVGLLLFCCLLEYLSSVIWFVDIVGLNHTSPSEIMRVLAAAGVRPGAIKEELAKKQIENTVLLNMPEISWVSLRFMGTRAVVEVAEKTLPKPESKEPADLVATKDGVICEAIVLAGIGQKKIGDKVRAGDVLIKSELQDKNVRAAGIIKAQIHYEGVGEERLSITVPQQTGNKVYSYKVGILGREFVLKQANEDSFEHFAHDVFSKKLYLWRNSDATVEFTREEFCETLPVIQVKTREACIESATRQALSLLGKEIPESAQIIGKNSEIIVSDDPNLITVKIGIETIEDIGQNINSLQGG